MTKKPHKDVHAAILAVMGEVGYCQKQKSPELKYTYAGEAALIAAIRPVLLEHGLTMLPVSSQIIESTSYETRGGAKMRLVRTVQRFKISHPDSGTFEVIEVLGEGADSGDKSVPKALTIGFKYALRQSFVIETGDDPDAHASVPEAPAKLSLSQGGVRKAVNEADQRSEADLPDPLPNPWLHVFEGVGASKSTGKALHELPKTTIDRMLEPGNRHLLTPADFSNLVAAVMSDKPNKEAA